MTISKRTLQVIVPALLVGAVAGYGIHAARASGIPATETLTYSGFLEDGAGPATGSYRLQVVFHREATGGTAVCQSDSDTVKLEKGRFSIPLPPGCATAVSNNPDLWVSVLVDGADTGRTRITASPYAVEARRAERASTADRPTPNEPLAMALDGLQAQTFPASYVHARIAGQASYARSVQTKVIYNLEVADALGEFSPMTGVFTARNAGTYVVTCSASFASQAPEATVDRIRAVLMQVEGQGEVAADIRHATQSEATLSATAIVRLREGDDVSCDVFQSGVSTALSHADSHGRTAIQIARIK